MIHAMIIYGLAALGIAGLAIIAGKLDNKKSDTECKKLPPDYIDKLPGE